ncbi:MAG: hypothetical protein ACLQNE_47065 [Thermoguttaceae bacterium]
MTTTATKRVYKTSPIKRNRRTKAEINAICDAMYSLLSDEHPQTIRHVFYVMETAGFIEKTEADYKGTICRLLGEMRKDGRLPYDWLTDNTRWRMKPTSYESLEDAMQQMQNGYRRDLWARQQDYVEVWTEKDAISSILYPITAKWDVPLMTARGYSSLSFLYSVAEDLKQIGKPSYLYYFGDHDPSGKDARRAVEETIHKMAPDVEVHFELVAVTREQIKAWKLPTRPTKKSDTRSGKFKGKSVEVDAIPSAKLQRLASDCIERHINKETLERTKMTEDAERDTLRMILENLEAA